MSRLMALQTDSTRFMTLHPTRAENGFLFRSLTKAITSSHRSSNYPLPNLYTSMLQRLGMEVEAFATATGTMAGLS